MTFNLKILKFLSIIILLSTKITLSYDNSHFYRAHFFNCEPRLDRDYLSSFDIVVGGGSTRTGLNAQNQKTCLLDICGCYNMQYLGKNVQKDMTKEASLIMQQLEQIPSNGNYALLSFAGEFNTIETDLSFYQNFKNGIFFNLHMPIRKLEINNIKYFDASCKTDQNCSLISCPSTQDANTYWKSFLNMFNNILTDYNLNISSTKQTGLGDISAVLGYTINYEDSDAFDFLDTTVKLGVIAPTSKIKNENYVFALPLGYNGHTGFFGSIETAFGVYDWITLGLHLDAISFNKICKTLRIKTADQQSGFIKLAQDTAREKMGNIYNASAYFKADHIAGGFSMLAAYSYSAKQNDELDCFKNKCTNCEIANSDCALQKWNMHTVHFLAEYDLAAEKKKYYPKINAFYNVVAGGKRVFRTNIGGAGVGLDIAWK